MTGALSWLDRFIALSAGVQGKLTAVQDAIKAELQALQQVRAAHT